MGCRVAVDLFMICRLAVARFQVEAWKRSFWLCLLIRKIEKIQRTFLKEIFNLKRRTFTFKLKIDLERLFRIKLEIVIQFWKTSERTELRLQVENWFSFQDGWVCAFESKEIVERIASIHKLKDELGIIKSISSWKLKLVIRGNGDSVRYRSLVLGMEVCSWNRVVLSIGHYSDFSPLMIVITEVITVQGKSRCIRNVA